MTLNRLITTLLQLAMVLPLAYGIRLEIKDRKSKRRR